MTNLALQYANDVTGGTIPANAFVVGACQRFLNDLDKAKHDKSYPYYYDKKEVKRATAFFEQYLLLSGGEPEAQTHPTCLLYTSPSPRDS